MLILKDKLEGKDSYDIYVISKQILKKLEKDNISQIIFDKIYNLIIRKKFSKETKKKIEYFCKELIIDLLTSGKNVKDIDKMLDYSFGLYFENDQIIIPTYKYIPEGLSNQEIKTYIDNISLEKRFEEFRIHLSPKINNYRVIFQVWGIIKILSEEMVKNLGFELYSPFEEKKLHDKNRNSEVFYRSSGKKKGDQESCKCNIIFSMKAISIDDALDKASIKYKIFMNLINVEFGNEYRGFFWNGDYIVEYEENSKFHQATCAHFLRDVNFRKDLSFDRPFVIDDERYKRIREYFIVLNKLTDNSLMIEHRALNNALDLLAKSIWESDENKFLNYWICLESLANISKKENESKIIFIKDSLSNMYFINEKFTPIKKLFRSLVYYQANDSENEKNIEWPINFLNDTGISRAFIEYEPISLVPFYKRVHELKSFIKDEVLLDEVEYVIEFYKDNRIALKAMKDKKVQIELTIDYIYKTRNQIVHNGYFAKNLIPFLVKYLEGYALSLFKKVVSIYLENEMDAVSYFIKEKYEGKLLEKKLESSEHYSIELS